MQVALHKDVTSYQEKIYGGVNKTQLVYFGSALACAVVAAAVCMGALRMDLSGASTWIMLAAIPAGVMGVWQPEGGLSSAEYLRVMVECRSARQRLPYVSRGAASQAPEGAERMAEESAARAAEAAARARKRGGRRDGR